MITKKVMLSTDCIASTKKYCSVYLLQQFSLTKHFPAFEHLNNTLIILNCKKLQLSFLHTGDWRNVLMLHLLYN